MIVLDLFKLDLSWIEIGTNPILWWNAVSLGLHLSVNSYECVVRLNSRLELSKTRVVVLNGQ